MKFMVAVFLALHGVIHLLGFLKVWQLAEVPQLTGATLFELPEPAARAVGGLWLIVCLMMIAAAAMRIVEIDSWWILAAIAIIISQLLIIYAWPDAGAGTIVNLLLIPAVLVAWADAGFQHETDAKIRQLYDGIPTAPAAIVTAENVEQLPAPVAHWLTASGVVGKPIPRSVRLKQRGQMRTAADKPFMPVEAQQYFRVDRPGFVWRVRVKMMKLLPIAGRDTFLDGHGRMLIKIASLFAVADVSDEKIDQGTLLRFLSEIVWFPAAALNPYITWEALGDNLARATMTYEGISASADFSFDERGRFTGLTARRYFGGGPEAKLESWSVVVRDWRQLSGLNLPVAGDVIWNLESGDYHFFAWEITEVEYDRPQLY